MSTDGDFDWRPIEADQAQAWSDLLAAMAAADAEQDNYLSAQDLLEEFSDPSLDFARGSVAVYHGGAMVGYCLLVCRSAADPVHEMRQQGGVHPDYRGRGLGGRLLEWAEEAAVPLHEQRYRGRPLILDGGCVSRNAAAVALYAAHGYQQARRFQGMIRDLSVPLPEAPVPAGLQIAGFTPERSLDARLVRNEAFRDHWGSTVTSVQSWTHFTEHRAFRPDLSFLAYAESEPIGIVLGEEFEAHTQATGRRDLHIPTVGTRRAGRGRGVASALLVRALTEARAAGFVTASLGVDADSPTGAVRLYQRAGFTVRDTWISERKTLLSAAAPAR